MTTTSSPVARSTAPAGVAAAVGGFLFVALGLLPGLFPDFAHLDTWMLAAALGLVLIVVGVAGLARSGLTGSGWPARIGTGAALLGLAVFALAHALAAVVPGGDDTPLFPIGGVLSAVGMVVAGVAVLRAGRWSGAGRLTPLVCGLYPFVVLIPAFALFGEPNFPAIAGLGAVWGLFGIALARAV
jgi:hypothetical protein